MKKGKSIWSLRRLVLIANIQRPTLKLSLIVFVFLAPFFGYTQTLPSGVVSATIVTLAPDSSIGSPNSTNVVSIKANSISNIAKAHLSVVDVSDSVLFSQVYDVKRTSVYNISGGYSITLRFFTQVDVGANLIKVQFEDTNNDLGVPFTVE